MGRLKIAGIWWQTMIADAGGVPSPRWSAQRGEGTPPAVYGHRFWLVALTTLVLTGCATVPTAYVEPPPLAPAARTAQNLKVFDRAWDLVNRKFFDAKFRGVDWAAMRARYRPQAAQAPDTDQLYTIINTMLEELKESHVGAQTPREAFEDQAKQRARIGIALARVEGRWMVTEVMPGSPAEAGGVRRGWLVVASGGKPFDEMVGHPLAEGRPITYDFLDEHDQPCSVALTPRLLSTDNRLESRELDGGVVYLRFDGFDRAAQHWLSDQLKAHLTAPAVVLDLRQNHGGWFFSLDIILGELFPKPVRMGKVILRNGHVGDEGSWQWSPARYPGRVILLVDSDTASCAEIFSDTLRYYHRAVLVGRKTSGQVMGARDYRLPDGGRLQVAVEDFLGLDGKRLEGVGVRPDIEVALKFADLREGRDADLAAALATLQPGAP
jgi:carboxyl-terminal processing protease